MAGKRAGSAAKNDADRLIGEAAAALYGLPLEEFTAARNDRAKQARAQGQTELAQAIAKLGKPNIVGWLANQLVREQRDEIDPLLELGASLREATSALDAGQVRALSKQQHQVVHALVQQARRLGSAAGQTVSDVTARGLEDTLHAALADPAAAEELLAGQLTSGLSRSGFPGVDVSSAARPAKRAAATKPGKPDRQDQAKQAREAKQDEADARAEAKAANTRRDQAQRALQEAEQAAQDAADDIDRLKAELEDANRARSDADKAKRQAAKDAERAERVARQADQRLASVTAKR